MILAYFWGLILTDHPVGKKDEEIRMKRTGANAAYNHRTLAECPTCRLLARHLLRRRQHCRQLRT